MLFKATAVIRQEVHLELETACILFLGGVKPVKRRVPPRDNYKSPTPSPTPYKLQGDPCLTHTGRCFNQKTPLTVNKEPLKQPVQNLLLLRP
jgi:hypothetical protein